MNLKLHIARLLMLGMMTLFMPSILFSQNTDSDILNRIWDYRRNFSQPVGGEEQNVYLRYSFGIDKRNLTLFLVPTMYVIAEGERQFVGESYCKMRFRSNYDFDLQRQVVWGTIPRNRMAMPAMQEFMSPNLYDVSLYPNHLLSPFHRSNRRYYKYQVKIVSGDMIMLRFRPKVNNTQLVTGHAIVEANTGRLETVYFEGEFDMIRFKVSAKMNQQEQHTPLPERCSTQATFNFLGNRVRSYLTAVYNCPTSLPDSMDCVADRELMEQLRPVPLNSYEMKIYNDHELLEKQEEEEAAMKEKQKQEEDPDTTDQKEHHDWLKEIAWDYIGDNLLNGNRAEVGHLSMRFSPLFNPLELGYSPSRGFRYRLKLGMRYSWNAHRFLRLTPQLSYVFKKKQFYYTIPLRMDYNPKRNGYAELTFANGNHISNDQISDDFHRIMGDSIEMPEFKDQYVEAINNVVAYDWLEIMTGVVYHRRRSLNPELMEKANMTSEFRSFAPMLTLRFTPWHDGPTLTANFEKGFKNIFQSNLEYERWEFDAVYKKQLSSLRYLNARVGSGFYTRRESNYFVDFANFRDNNLPQGWEDDWSGDFQLLNSSWYNESNYYLRANLSYETPMLGLSHLPLIGRTIEKERIYLSALSIQHTRPYFELGYGFTNRFFSTALFTNFLGGKIQEFGCEFTIEIFRRW